MKMAFAGSRNTIVESLTEDNDNVTKSFTIENTSNADTYAKINLGNIKNDYKDDSIKYVLKDSETNAIIAYGTLDKGITNSVEVINGLYVEKTSKKEYAIDLVLTDASNQVDNASISVEVDLDDTNRPDGSEEHPLLINMIEDLVDLSNTVNAGEAYTGKYFKLIRDLDFKSSSSYKDATRTDYRDLNGDGIIEDVLTELTKTTAKGFTPIGTTESNAFKGNFDGDNHEISNLYINNNTENIRIGFFGVIDSGNISNFGIKDGSITSSVTNNIGGIVGTLINSNFNNCHNDNMQISGKNDTGLVSGLIGSIIGDSEISNCHNSGNISGGASTSGIIASISDNSNVQIRSCYNTVMITLINGLNGAGGIVGSASENGLLKIYQSYNEGNIISNRTSVSTSPDLNTISIGGLIGYSNMDLVIDDSHNSGEIEIRGSYNNYSQESAGGLVAMIGSETGRMRISAVITNSYNTGNIIGYGNKFGGIVAYIGDTKITLNNLYNTGNLSMTNSGTYYNNPYNGGLIGCPIYSLVFILNAFNTGNVISNRDYIGGFIGANYDSNSYIVNSYNMSDVITDNTSASSGIAGTRHSSYLYTNNVFYSGTLFGASSYLYGIGYLRDSTTSSINNSYFDDTYSAATNKTMGNPISKDDMKKLDFVDLLNNNRKTIIENDLSTINSNFEGYTLSEWCQGTNDYPILKDLQGMNGAEKCSS